MTKPLQGRAVLVTRAKGQFDKFIALLESQGAQCIEIPLIKIVPPVDTVALDRAIAKIGSYNWIIFTSTNGVKFFFDRLEKLSIGKEALKMNRVVAIGPATAKAVAEKEVEVESVPKEFKGEGVIELFSRIGMLGQRVLIPRAKEAREILPDTLRKMGATVQVPVTYETIIDTSGAERLKEALVNDELDVITFTSSSTVKNFIELTEGLDLTKLLNNVAVACIGPITGKTAIDCGLKVAITADEHTVEGLSKALVDFFVEKTETGSKEKR